MNRKTLHNEKVTHIFAGLLTNAAAKSAAEDFKKVGFT